MAYSDIFLMLVPFGKDRTLDDPCQMMTKFTRQQLQLSDPAYHGVLMLSRMIVDFVGSIAITQEHLAEALQYRPKLELM
jgi:magnesium chelatase family protein